MRRPVTGLLLLLALALVPRPGAAHPLGNFSVSHYAALRIRPDAVELTYLLDLAEIPTFEETRDAGLVLDPDDPGRAAYLARRALALREGLRLELDGRPLALEEQGRDLSVAPGAGGLPTVKLGVRFRAPLAGRAPAELRYRDANFSGRAGWHEVVAVAAPGVVLLDSSVPAADRSRALSDYPTDLLASPPQDLAARIVFAREAARPVAAASGPAAPAVAGTGGAGPAAPSRGPLALAPNRQAPPPGPLAALVARPRLDAGIVGLALLVAMGLGALHALEPGHGKTMVAAYLVGSRGTAWHAGVLGLVVTAAHTAGVYLLGAIVLYASRHVVPERLYPWLAVLSGLTIAALGAWLFLRHCAGTAGDAHGHGHAHGPGHAHDDEHSHDHGHARGHPATGAVRLRELVALGVSGGIVPCPGALVVLLSAVALGRVALGLVLIVAFSLGLAAVLVAIGLLTVYAGRLLAGWHAGGPLVTRWLPLTSAAVITVLGLVIAARTLVAAGIVPLHLV